MPYALTIWVFSFSLLLGCAACKVSFETRRDSDIDFNKQRLSSTKSKVVSKWSQEILSALQSVNATNIRKPRLASAILANNHGGYGLIVFWIEDYPSVDTVEFTFDETPSSTTNILLDIDLKQVQEEAKSGIVFGSEHDWDNTSEMWKHLEQITSTNDLKVRLLRANAPVTDWFPVDFYKVDRWVSGAVTNK